VRAEREAHRSEIAADALRECGPETCEALLRGELALGMSEVEVLAATGTTPEAWFVRDAGPATVMTPVSAVDPPRDAVAGLAMVQLRDGRVARYGYRETRGLRVVDSPEDATLEGRAEGLADLLVREGDEYAAAGDFVRALDRYDRADVLTDDPLVAYKIGAALDKQLRPIEALIQYRLFLHRLELEKIEARGAAAGHLAEAIAQARQRVLILEREAR
jgi:tetratricopeptide (TPR) repeat protein